MIRFVLAAAVVLASAAQAQGQEFTLPAFTSAPDGGVPEPSPPPPPPADANPLIIPKEKPPAQPRWNRIAGSVGALVTGNQQLYLGGELTLLAALGSLKPAGERAVEGWLFMAGANANYGRVHGALCRGSTFCAERFAGGLALKSGWAKGAPGSDGGTRANLMFYGQLDVLAAYFSLPSAPLAPGVSAWEALLRLRLGAHWSRLGESAAKSNLTANVALVIEGVPTVVNRGVSFGLVGGIAF